jgi:hypothetical protein
MTLRRKLMLCLAACACIYAFMAPVEISGLGSIECAAPQYFEGTTSVDSLFDNDAGMTALREQAGLALAQLQTKSTR